MKQTLFRIKSVMQTAILGMFVVPFFVRAQVFENPLGEGSTIQSVILNVIEFLRNAATIALVPLFIIIGAMQMLTAGGNKDQITRGKQTLIWTSVGYMILLLAEGIVKTIIKVITSK